MRIRKAFRSLRFRLAVLLAAFSLGVAALLIYNNASALNILRTEVCTAARDLLVVSQKRLDDSFSSAASYLATFVTQQEDIEILERSTLNTTAYHISVARIQRQFISALPGHIVDSFFYLDDSRALCFSNAGDLQNPLRSLILASQPLITPNNAGKWFVLSTRGDAYLLRAVRVGRSYVGAWVKVRSALEQVRSGQLADSDIYLMDGQGTFLGGGTPDITLDPVALSGAGGYTFVRAGGEQYLAVSQRVRFGDFYLVALIPDAALSGRFQKLTWVIALVSAFALFMLSVSAALLRHLIVRPIAQLTGAIRALQRGDFAASLPDQTYEEFTEVNRAFNQATREIQTLKIDMYEERLLKQKIHTQYLQSQIAPHFLINCLNTIYQLTDADEPDVTRAMLRVLSEHLRYTLSASEHVPLDEELRHVENYVELSAIRYPGSVSLVKDYDPDSAGAMVIPMLILNFVENAVKYEAGMGKQLTIHVSTRLTRAEGGARVRMCVWDTGGGFDESVLADLQDVPSFLKKHGDRHIGIGNVFQRAGILFPDCGFAFANRPGAGAQIDIDVPYIPYWQEGGRE